jgi:hypothetical protein
MDAFKSWLLGQGFYLLIGVLFIVLGVITSAIWKILEKVEHSTLGFFVRSVICLLAIVVGWVSIGGLIGLFFRDYPNLKSFLKMLFEGPWISFVTFKAIPKNGKYVAALFLLFYTGFLGYLAHLAFSEREQDALTTTDGVKLVFYILTSVGVYLVFLKIKNKPY